MELKLPPVVVFVVFGGMMYLLDRFLPFGEFDFFGRQWLIYLLAAMAMGIGVVAVFQFIRERTSVDPRVPEKANKLVMGGLYRFSRNPMYLGLLLALLAFGLLLGNAFNTIIAALFVSYMNRFQIQPEEKVLTTIFGNDYQRYCAKVRRWF